MGPGTHHAPHAPADSPSAKRWPWSPLPRIRPEPAAAARAKAALWGLLALLACEGLLNGWASGVNWQVPPSWGVLFKLCQIVLIYHWLREDARAQGVQRTLGGSGLVILLALLGVPAYLWRSRPPGARAKALLRFVGFVFVAAGTYLLAGAPLAYWLGGA